MADNEQKAFQLMADAEKKLNSSKGFFRSLFGGDSNKVDEATECYMRAANLLKMAKNWPQAAQAFAAAARLYAREGRRHDEASCYVDAAKCWKKSDPQKSVDALGRAVAVYLDMGRFALAAKHEESIAATYETETADGGQGAALAIKHYELAADYYRAESSDATAGRCMLKVAQLAARAGDHSRAAQLYEEAAEAALASSLVRFSARDYLFRAAVSMLCVDSLDAQRALARYKTLCPSFADARECQLVAALADALEEQDEEAFDAAVLKYESVSRLDASLAALLQGAKAQIDGMPHLK